jgi:hypothetical protein
MDVVDSLEVDTEFFCNAHGIDRRVSMLIVVNPNVSHVVHNTSCAPRLPIGFLNVSRQAVSRRW